MTYEWDFSILPRYAGLLAEGLANTILLSVASIVAGAALGLLVAALRLSGRAVLAAPTMLAVELLRTIPGLVLLFWVYYALPVLTGIVLSPFMAAWVAFSVQASAFYSEVYRGGILSIDRGQWEASRALGMTPFAMMRRIIVPQALRRMVPPMVERSFEVVKTTPLAATVTFGELVYQASAVITETYRPMEVYTTIAGVYFLCLLLASIGSGAFERALRKRGG